MDDRARAGRRIDTHGRIRRVASNRVYVALPTPNAVAQHLQAPPPDSPDDSFVTAYTTQPDQASSTVWDYETMAEWTEGFPDAARAARAALERALDARGDWLGSYRERRARHDVGVDPGGLAGWTTSWSITEFNAAFRARSFGLDEDVRLCEDLDAIAMQAASDWNIHVSYDRESIARQQPTESSERDSNGSAAPEEHSTADDEMEDSSQPDEAHPPHVEIYDNSLAELPADLRSALAYFELAQDDHDQWRAAYKERKASHLAGEDPGDLDGWRPDWTMEDFDAAYRVRAGEMVDAVTWHEKRVAEGIRIAKRRKLIAYSDQESNFPSTEGGYTSDTERLLASAAPVERIRSWQGNVPWVETTPLSPNAMPDARRHDPPMDDVGDYSNLRAVDVWDSWSLIAFDPWRRRIDAWQQRVEANAEAGSRLVAEGERGRRPQWTLNGESRVKLKTPFEIGVGREQPKRRSWP